MLEHLREFIRHCANGQPVTAGVELERLMIAGQSGITSTAAHDFAVQIAAVFEHEREVAMQDVHKGYENARNYRVGKPSGSDENIHARHRDEDLRHPYDEPALEEDPRTDEEIEDAGVFYVIRVKSGDHVDFPTSEVHEEDEYYSLKDAMRHADHLCSLDEYTSVIIAKQVAISQTRMVMGE
jgi:hypothetical protein